MATKTSRPPTPPTRPPRSRDQKASPMTPSAAPSRGSQEESVRPMSAQEPQDETMLQWKPRTPAQAREDEALLERLPRQADRRSLSGTPRARATTARWAHVRRRRSASTRRQALPLVPRAARRTWATRAARPARRTRSTVPARCATVARRPSKCRRAHFGSNRTRTSAAVIIRLPLAANRLSVIDTGTVVSFIAVTSALAVRVGSLVNTPRLAG